jgi:hypothetical protein
MWQYSDLVLLPDWLRFLIARTSPPEMVLEV